MGLNETDDEQPISAVASPKASSPKANASESEHGVRIKKGAILSDDEGEDDAPNPAGSKGVLRSKNRVPPIDPEAERSLRAMMDIDDGLFLALELSGCPEVFLSGLQTRLFELRTLFHILRRCNQKMSRSPKQ